MLIANIKTAKNVNSYYVCNCYTINAPSHSVTSPLLQIKTINPFPEENRDQYSLIGLKLLHLNQTSRGTEPLLDDLLMTWSYISGFIITASRLQERETRFIMDQRSGGEVEILRDFISCCNNYWATDRGGTTTPPLHRSRIKGSPAGSDPNLHMVGCKPHTHTHTHGSQELRAECVFTDLCDTWSVCVCTAEPFGTVSPLGQRSAEQSKPTSIC